MITFHLSNTLAPRNYGRPFADGISKCIFFNENCIWIKILPWGPIENSPALVEVMAWRRRVDKPLPQPVMTKIHDAIWRHLNTNSYHWISISDTNVIMLQRQLTLLKQVIVMHFSTSVDQHFFNLQAESLPQFAILEAIRHISQFFLLTKFKKTNHLVSPGTYQFLVSLNNHTYETHKCAGFWW